MTLVVKNRIKCSTSTTGTGTITVGSAISGYQDFTAIGDGNTTYFAIVDGTDWEVSSGVYTSSGTTLSRTLISSSTGSLLNLSGTATVFVDLPAEKAVFLDTSDLIATAMLATGTPSANTVLLGNRTWGNAPLTGKQQLNLIW